MKLNEGKNRIVFRNGKEKRKIKDLLVSEMRRVNKETIRERKWRERRMMKRKKENENEEKDDVEWWQREKERKGRNELVLFYCSHTRLPRIETSIVFFASLLLTRGNPEYRPELTDDIMV